MSANRKKTEPQPEDERRNQVERGVPHAAETCPTSILVADESATVVFANTASKNVLGVPREELIGRRVDDLGIDFRRPDGSPLPADEFPLVIAARNRRDALDVELNLISPEGERRFLVCGASPALKGGWALATILDITKCKSIQEELLRESAELEAVFQVFPDLLLRIGPDDRIKDYHVGRAADLCVPPKQFLGKRSIETLPPSAAAAVAEAIRKARETGSMVSVEYSLPSPSGEQSFEARVIPASENEILMVQRNTTERARAEEALRAGEARYRAVVEDQTELICRFLPDLRQTFVNEAYARYFGKTQAELVGRSFLKLIPEEDRERVTKYIAGLTRQDPVGVLEHRVLGADGEVRWQQWVDRAIYDDNGQLVEFQSVGRDITERVRMEQALRQTTSEMQAILDAIPDLYFRLDSEGVFLDYHAATFAQLYLPPEEFLGKRYLDVLPPDVARDLEHAIRETQQTGGPITFEYSLLIAGQSQRYEARLVSMLEDQTVAMVRNITERKLAEDALKESEEKYRSVVETANDGIVIAQDRIVQFANRRLAEMLGVSVEDQLGRPFTDFVYPNEIPKALESYEARVAGEWTTVFETAAKRKNGERVDVEISGVLITFRGAPAQLAFIRDITERKRAAEALKESERRFRSLIETMNEGFATVSSDYVFTYVNARFAEMLAYAPDEMVGRHLEAFLDETNRAIWRDQVVQGQAAGRKSYELAWDAKDGRRVCTLVSPSRVFDADGRFAEGFAVLTDITEIKQAEEALTASEAKYRELIEDISDWVWEADAESLYTYCSPAVERILSYTPEEVVGTRIFELMLEEDAKHCARVFSEAVEQRCEVSLLPCRIRHKDGSVRYLETTATPKLDEQGRVIGFRGINRNMTERVTAEEDKRRFYRTAIFALTEGKLDIVTPEEAAALAEPAAAAIAVPNAEATCPARAKIRKELMRHGLMGDRLDAFVVAVGEALNNAVKHAGGGVISTGFRNGAVWVSVADSGPGIGEMFLPRAVLEKGYSTAASLGFGYSIILDAADKVALSTGPDGTTVVMQKILAPAESVTPLIERIPDTW